MRVRTRLWLCCGMALMSFLLCVAAQRAASAIPGMRQEASPPPPQESELTKLWKDGAQALDRKNYPAAEKLWSEGLEKAKAADKPAWIAGFQHSLGRIEMAREQWERALEWTRSALQIRERLGNKSELASSLNNLGIIYRNMRQYEEAISSHRRAIALYESLKNPENAADALASLSDTYYELARFEEAAQCLERALKIAEAANLPRLAARYLSVLGSIHSYGLARYDEALNYQMRAQELWEKLDDPRRLAIAIQNLGAAYSYLGRYEEGLEKFRQAQKLFEKQRDAYGVSSCIASQGLMLAGMKQYARAAKLFQGGLALAQLARDADSEAYTRIGLGLLEWYQHHYEASRDHFARALDYYRALPSPDFSIRQNTAYCQGGLAMALHGLGRYEEALPHIAEADAFSRETNNRRNMAICAGVEMMILASMNRLEEAQAAARRMLENLESLTEQVGEGSQLGQLLDVLPHPYAQAAEIVRKRNRPEDALALLERGRGQGLAKQARQNRIALDRFLRPEDAAMLKERTRALNAAGSLRRAVLTRNVGRDSQSVQQYARQMQEAESRYRQAQEQLTRLRDRLFARPEYAAYRRLEGARPPSAAELKALARRHPDTLFLEWAIIDEERALLIAISGRGGERAMLLSCGEKALSGQVADWRAAIRAGSAEEPKRARALYDLLFGPLESAGLLRQGAFKRLTLVAEGPLMDVPFAALMDKDGRRLIGRYAFSLAVSLASLTWAEPRRAPAANMLCVADPTGSAGSRNVSRSRGAFSPLPGARREGQAVTRMFDGSRLLMGRQAREADVKRAIGRYGVLHFATHGAADSKNGMQSFLALAAGGEEDGFLEAREIVEMRLSARLATLSACQTAQGQKSGGEGLLGLAWAFQAAGCPSVVASLWKVDDEATQQLMVAFYKELQAGRRKDDALRQAILQVKGRPRTAAPSFWAAFQTLGDAGPLDLPESRPPARRQDRR